MTKIVTDNIGNARDITLLGGRLQLDGRSLSLGEKDLFHEGTAYYYIKQHSDREEFLDSLRKHYVSQGAVQVFDKAVIHYELKYLPVLKCGDKLLALNNEDDDFITDSFFSNPLSWNSSWDSMISPIANGCLQKTDLCILAINLSYKEISYLAPRLGLTLSDQLQIVLIPFHVASITSKKKEYHVAQMALLKTEQVRDYPLFDDETFSAITHVFFLLTVYGTCAMYIAMSIVEHADQVLPFLKSYGNWWTSLLHDEIIRKTLNDYVPIIGWLVGMVIETILLILIFIIAVVIVPAILIIIPAIVSFLFAVITIWFRRLLLRIKKARLFDNAVARSFRR